MLALNFLKELYFKRNEKSNKLEKIGAFFEVLANNFLYLNCLIQPSHNLIVLCLWSLKEKLFSLIFEKNKKTLIVFESKENLIFFFNVISWSCYFSQGNSNSLNTIQVSSGFVGVNNLNELLVGILILLVTYSSILYWFFIMIKYFILFLNEFQSNQRYFINIIFRLLILNFKRRFLKSRFSI